MRGGEKVLLSLARLFPEAPIFTLLHVRGSVAPELEAREIHTTFVQRLPDVERRYRHYLPLFPAAAASHRPARLRPRGLELALRGQGRASDAARAAPLLLPHADALRLGPLRRLLRPRTRLRRSPGASYPFAAEGLRAWDAATAARVHRFAANSAYVAGRIRRYYGRDAEVIPPPVDTDFFTPGADGPGAFDLVVSALAPYKRARAALEAYRGTGRPLRIVGTGPERGAPASRGAARGHLPGLGRRRGAPGPLSRLPGGAHAGGRGLRDRPPRSHGLRAAGGRLRRGRRKWRPSFRGGPASSSRSPPPDALRAAVDSLETVRFNGVTLRAQAEAHSRRSFESRFRAFVERALAEEIERRNRHETPERMVKFQTRMMVATFVLVDVAATVLAWILAYFLRFDALSWALHPRHQGRSRALRLPVLAAAHRACSGRRCCTSTASTG